MRLFYGHSIGTLHGAVYSLLYRDDQHRENAPFFMTEYGWKPFWGLFDILGVLLGDPRGVDAIKAEIWSDDWFILILKFIQILDLAVV